MNNIAVVTTFPNNMWDVYARQMLQSFIAYWPQEVPLCVQLDDDLLYPDIDKLLRPQDGIAVGRNKEHEAFVKRHAGKDDPQNYRMQPVRFCHKIFALYRAFDAASHQGDMRYLIWLDADVATMRPVSFDDIQKALPKEGDAVAYLGRKDWEHSECGWLAFDLHNGGDKLIKKLYDAYVTDKVMSMEQKHDSWVFDKLKPKKSTNLTKDKAGTEIWEQSPMAAWSKHYKGPIAKQKLLQPMAKGQNFVIQTKNSIPDEQIQAHIKENQGLIKNWLTECKPTKEEITVVSAGPLLIPEDVKGKKIVAVKHALKPLKEAGITPWACILLDPRPHVADFVEDADPKVKWFVASQVNPVVTKILLERGCEVWGYHASVGANEGHLTIQQKHAIISGGSATATRGLYLLYHLGFRNFNLYGYDLCYFNKPDMEVKDQYGQYKYVEFSVGVKNAVVEMKRNFYTEPQLVAQFEEMKEILLGGKMKIKAHGYGMVPFMYKLLELTDLRLNKNKCMIGSYKRLFIWQKTKSLLMSWRNNLSKLLQKRKKKTK